MSGASTKDDEIWVRRYPDDGGRYRLVLELGPDEVEPDSGGVVVPLSVDQAYQWAREVLVAVATAEYDAAILGQALSLGMDVEVATAMLTEARAERLPPEPMSLAPGLSITAGVSMDDHRPFVVINRYGQPIGEWDLPEARGHVLGVMQAAATVNLDEKYLLVLTRGGLPQEKGMRVIHDLDRFRPEVGA